MARSVSLSDDAFLTLRREKREGESDSDVVLRLQREAQARRKDPAAFFVNPPPASWTSEDYDRIAARMRREDRARMQAAREEATGDARP